MLSGLPWGVQHRARREIIRIEVDAVLDGGSRESIRRPEVEDRIGTHSREHAALDRDEHVGNIFRVLDLHADDVEETVVSDAEVGAEILKRI